MIQKRYVLGSAGLYEKGRHASFLAGVQKKPCTLQQTVNSALKCMPKLQPCRSKSDTTSPGVI